jgi:predicted nucleic acid-binding protein
VKRVLFDTTILSYWHGGDGRFERPLERLFRELGQTKTTLYVSSVTIQEIGCFAMGVLSWPAVSQFLAASRINMLPFCAGCAIAAARLRAQGGPPASRGDQREAVKAKWHHDAAIVGTAVHHGLDMIVTSDRVLATRYGGFFEEIRYLDPSA